MAPGPRWGARADGMLDREGLAFGSRLISRQALAGRSEGVKDPAWSGLWLCWKAAWQGGCLGQAGRLRVRLGGMPAGGGAEGVLASGLAW